MKCILDLPNEVVNMIIEYVGNCKINEKGEIFTWNKIDPTDIRYLKLITGRKAILCDFIDFEGWHVRGNLSEKNHHYFQMKYSIRNDNEIIYEHTYRKGLRNHSNYVLTIKLSDIYNKNEIYKEKIKKLQKFYQHIQYINNEYSYLTK